MKKWLILLGLLVVSGAGYLGGAQLSGGAWPTPGLDIGGDRGDLRRAALSFWEDIQFKDFERAASYHAPALQESVDIPFLIERLFAVKPEVLEIMEYEIVYAEIDSTGERARVKCRIKLQELVKGMLRDQEIILYFHRDPETGEWFMKLEDSLRQAEAEEGKKH